MREERKIDGKANRKFTRATSKPSLRIELDPFLLKQLRGLSRDDRRTLGNAINQAISSWGHPHLHAGVGVRKLIGDFYECRSGLKTRLVFEPKSDGTLYFHLMGNHDEIQRFIKSSR